MNIILNRTCYSKYGIDGQLLINHHEVCNTLEHPTTYLPPGTYTIKIRRHPKLRRMVPYIEVPPPEDGSKVPMPYIGIGNGPFKLKDGGILIGKTQVAGLVVHSAETFAKLIDRLDKAQNRKEPITLTIQ